MRRSCQLPDSIRLLRLKWPSGVLMERKMQDCYWAQAFDKPAHSFRWPLTQFIHISLCSGFTPKSTLLSQLEDKLISSTKCMILLFQTYLHFFWESFEECAGSSLCMKIFSGSQVVYNWANLGVLILVKLLCSVPFALHALILSSTRIFWPILQHLPSVFVSLS